MPRKEKHELVKPKRPATAFILFCNDERPKLQSEHPEMKFGEIGKHLGELWNTCSDKQKKKYTEKSLKEKERYGNETAEYIKAGGDPDDLKRRRKTDRKEKTGKKTEKKKEKDPDAPKKPKSAYLFFSLEERELLKKEQPSLNFGDVGKLIGERWKRIKPEAKNKYQKMAEEAKAKYDAELKAYQASTSSTSSSTSTTSERSKKKNSSTSTTRESNADDVPDSGGEEEDDDDDDEAVE